MEIKELLRFRNDLFEESKDENGVLTSTGFIVQVLPYLLDSKKIDSEDFTESYLNQIIDGTKIQINGYGINDSKERLFLFILNENALSDSIDVEISTKEYYDDIFKTGISFIKKSINKHLEDIQQVGEINTLIHHLSSSKGIEQFDAIEIFLISPTVTIETRGSAPQLKRIEFKDEFIKTKFVKNNDSREKEILVIKSLVDMNFLHSVLLSQGNRDPLLVNFEEDFDYKIEAIKAADEQNFESYLCVLPASVLSKLYLKYSSRLLEKNVRSFLQFKGVNQKMRETLIKDPEKFIAFNNGLTITAADKDIEIDNGKYFIKSLSDFQIVNGGQTTASIYFSHKDGVNIDKVKVMAKINVAKNISEDGLNDLIADISKYSNSQSKVTTVDLNARNPQLNRIKSLTESVLTPSGKKWFFEKSKGEFNTLLRIAGSSGKNRIEKQYPKDFRFTKEMLGKYFCAWGNEPYLIKKGGEAIFRKFIEKIDTSELKNNLDRNFYELLIAKIILFKNLEEIHGTRSNAIGQLRSAVVPYTISVIYNHFEGDKKNTDTFDLFKIWNQEGIQSDLKEFFFKLMEIINELIKSIGLQKSDDLGEYSKKKELWDAIVLSSKLESFMETNFSRNILKKYSISKVDFNKKIKNSKSINDVSFEILHKNVLIHSNGAEYYKGVLRTYENNLTTSEVSKLEMLISSIKKNEDIPERNIAFESQLMSKIRSNSPGILDNLPFNDDFVMSDSYEYIVLQYNKCVENGTSIKGEFDKIYQLAEFKKSAFPSVFKQIGELLETGNAPSIKQVYNASFYVSDKSNSISEKNENSNKQDLNKLNEFVLKKMMDFDLKYKVLTTGERKYLTDFVYGFKKLNAFHESNIKRHLDKMVDKGFELD
jgi:hypothetical protein